MCILVVAVGCHPVFPLIVAHNRDEQRSRPSRPESFEPETELVCGRDGVSGGTVAALHTVTGRLAALTNVRSKHVKPDAGKASRGVLVERLVDRCTGGTLADDYVRILSGSSFDGCHVIFGHALGLAPTLAYAWVAAEEDDSGNLVSWQSGDPEELGVGVFVVSNENPTITRAVWPKCTWLKAQVEDFLAELPAEASVADVHKGLVAIMGKYDVPGLMLPSQLPSGFPREKEVLLHTGSFTPWRPQFPEFGTVSQRILVSSAKTQSLAYFHRIVDEHGTPAKIWEQIEVPWSGQSETTKNSPAPQSQSATAGSQTVVPQNQSARAGRNWRWVIPYGVATFFASLAFKAALHMTRRRHVRM